MSLQPTVLVCVLLLAMWTTAAVAAQMFIRSDVSYQPVYSDTAHGVVRRVHVLGKNLADVTVYAGTVGDVVDNRMISTLSKVWMEDEFIEELCDFGGVRLAGGDWLPTEDPGVTLEFDVTQESTRPILVRLCKLAHKETGKWNVIADRMYYEPSEL